MYQPTEYIGLGDWDYAQANMAAWRRWAEERRAKRLGVAAPARVVKKQHVERVDVKCCVCGEMTNRLVETVRQAQRSGAPGVYCDTCAAKKRKACSTGRKS